MLALRAAALWLVLAAEAVDFHRQHGAFRGTPLTTTSNRSLLSCAVGCVRHALGCEGFTVHDNGPCALYGETAGFLPEDNSTGQRSFLKNVCPDGFSPCAGGCVTRVEEHLEHAAAASACAALGAHLAVPRSDQENQCVRELAAGEDVWIGLDDVAEAGVFAAADGGESFSADSPFWASGEPKNTDGAYCVQMWGTSGWDDVSCYYTQKSVCQVRP